VGREKISGYTDLEGLKWVGTCFFGSLGGEKNTGKTKKLDKPGMVCYQKFRRNNLEKRERGGKRVKTLTRGKKK